MCDSNEGGPLRDAQHGALMSIVINALYTSFLSLPRLLSQLAG